MLQLSGETFSTLKVTTSVAEFQLPNYKLTKFPNAL